MTTSDAQAFVNQYGHREDFSRLLDRQKHVERDECPLGSEVCWFFADGSIIWHDLDAAWEIIDGVPSVRGEGAEPLRRP